MSVIGLMSGTSVDGIGAAWVDIHPSTPIPHIQLKAFSTFPFPNSLRESVLAACGHPPIQVEDICALNFRLGEAFATAVIKLAKANHVSLKQIDLIASHGQTIRHLPPSSKSATGSTLQIGEPAIIAERTGVTTVADFRPADMAAGGQGAPLASYLHYCLFRGCNVGVGVQNIGGIGNLTFIKKGGTLQDVIAFDTGPGNVLMDATMYMLTGGRQRFDRNGSFASRGKVNHRLLGRLLSHPYFKKRYPKTTGREIFGCSMAQRLVRQSKGMKGEDLMATLTAFTAHSIAKSCEQSIHPLSELKELIIGGGGAKNKLLFYMIQHLLPSVQLKRFEDYQWNSDAIEAMAFALLGYETVNGRASNLPSVTGAAHPALLGKIIPGDNFKSLSLK